MANEQGMQGNANVETGSTETGATQQSGTQVENPNGSSSEGAASQNTAWIGGVKKEAREKGRQEGYQEAMEEIRRQLMAGDNPQQAQHISEQQKIQQPIQQQQSSSQQQHYNPDEIANQAAKIAQKQQFEHRYNQIGAKAVAKYGDTYVNKMTEYNQQAASLSESEDPVAKQWGHQMQSLALMSADIGGEDLVYKLATDENFRNEMLATNQILWQQKLMNHSINSQPTAQQMASQKVNGSPNEGLPKSTSYGDMAEKSWEERRQRVKRRSF